MVITLVLLTNLLFSDLYKTEIPLSDVFIERFHGAAKQKKQVAILNFSQMKTKLLIVNIQTYLAYEINDPRLKIFGSRKVIAYKTGFLVIRNNAGYQVTDDLKIGKILEFDTFEGFMPQMLWSGIQPIQNGQFLCRFIEKEGLHVFKILDLEAESFLPLHDIATEKNYTVLLLINEHVPFVFHNKTGSVVEHDSAFKPVRRLLPELPLVKRSKNSRLYRRNPNHSLINHIFSDATAVWFDIYLTELGTGDIERKRYKLEGGKLHAVSSNLVTLARFEEKHLSLDTEEGTLVITPPSSQTR
ncbi:hypothetical protein [Acanthopleuribacter pedis]|uniref:Uncharacterized protein n=1 Tax=Acanthopleuribacter pedis TaxID=442870 RepID=A0A8J7QBM3_9BACT|nr:hypothetical protein [Acanthopleuribacter pedis]MBO1317966.1 hypothetical protein [Acanthopleuribacter pedis]